MIDVNFQPLVQSVPDSISMSEPILLITGIVIGIAIIIGIIFWWKSRNGPSEEQIICEHRDPQWKG